MIKLEIIGIMILELISISYFLIVVVLFFVASSKTLIDLIIFVLLKAFLKSLINTSELLLAILSGFLARFLTKLLPTITFVFQALSLIKLLLTYSNSMPSSMIYLLILWAFILLSITLTFLPLSIFFTPIYSIYCINNFKLSRLGFIFNHTISSILFCLLLFESVMTIGSSIAPWQ